MLVLFSFLIFVCVSQYEVNIEVNVVDESGEPVDGARISLVPVNGNFASNSFTTDSEGKVSAVLIAVGSVNIIVSKDGYFTAVNESVELVDGMTLEFVLEPSRG